MGKGKKHNLNWIRTTLELKDDHHWQSAPGTQIFVAGRGAVRFDIPQGWHFSPQESSFQFLDKTPPEDNCRLEVSYNLLPYGNWAEFPLAPLLKNLVKEDSRFSGEVGEIHYLKRQTARVVWTEFPFIDPQEHRQALARLAIGLGSNVQCLITLDFWQDEAEQFTPVWDLVLSSLVLGLFIKDPRTGLALPD